MSITDLEKGLFTDAPRLRGEAPGHHPNQFSISKAGEDAMLFGQAVMEGASPDQVLKYDGAGAKFIGIARWSKDGNQVIGDDRVGYNALDSIAVCQAGFMNVIVEDTVVEGDPVRVLHTGANKGNFQTGASAGNSALIGGMIFKSSADAGEVAQVELNGFASFTVTDDT